MKRQIAFLLILICIFSLCACESGTGKNNTYTFYYVKYDDDFHGNSDIIVPFSPDINNTITSQKEILNIYFNGPTNYACRSPFPSGTTLQEYSVTKNRATLTLSPQFCTITGTERTIAFACITKTVIALADVKFVQIAVQGSRLDGEDFLTFTENSFTYQDTLPVN